MQKLGNLGFQYLGNSLVQAAGDSVSAYFTDLRDSCLVHTNVRMFGVGWDVKYVKDPKPEGQLIVIASIVAGATLDHRRAEMIVYQLLHSQAQIFCIQVQATFQNGTFRATVEYCDVAAAHAAATRFTDTVIEVCPHPICYSVKFLALRFQKSIQLNAIPLSTDCLVPSSGSSVRDGVFLDRDPDGRRYALGGTLDLDQVVGVSPAQPTPLSPYTWGSPSFRAFRSPYPVHPPSQLPRYPRPSPSMGHEHESNSSREAADNPSQHRNMSGHSRLDFRRQGASRFGRGPYHGIPTHHNHVDIHRIQEGTDVRTTASPYVQSSRSDASLNYHLDHASKHSEQG